ncbi:hypothetical protein ACVWZ3_008179 [Bradyrhizobium sp. i1.3.6]
MAREPGPSPRSLLWLNHCTRPNRYRTIRPLPAGCRSCCCWLAAGIGGLVMLGALALWFHYGSQVFFEMIRTGFAACF